ncbi:ParB/RepB/Spo0J family partition protein [Yinghuangia soli]|uniref:ParB/RepB/Spo0J family partition protein n=1 Tax=Yinghuangia soli TaxID=2908204 RepID=A0AA41U4N1_9ACTN|nr:ParB/RepB/Spo0J family partition protein [Yinghuangia soli]MCF2533893.1 ParB/RepB/Spo0J family partition protein [Yinghuangia soli]
MNERRRGLGRGLGSLIPAGGNTAALTKPLPEPAAPEATATSWPVVLPDHTAPAATGLGARKLLDGRATEAPAEVPAAEADAPTSAGTVDGAWFAELPIGAITPNPRQPRDYFDEEALAELVHSIKEVGLLQPIVVRQVEAERYELIMGERRWRASQEAGLEVIPAIVRATEDDKLLLDALLENLHRSELNAIEEAAAYDQLLKDFGCTQDELADRIGRSRPQVTNTLRLLRLPPEVQVKIQAGTLSAGHARALLGLRDAEAQIELAERIIREGLSVRSVEEIVHMRKFDEEQNGATPAKQRPAPRMGKRVSPALNELANRLKDRFETSVSVDLGQKKGKIVVEFASIEDLERILAVMAPGESKILANRLAPQADVPAQGSAETAEPVR